MSKLPVSLLLLAVLAVLTSSVYAQSPEPREPASIMIVGVYHFANPGRDVVKTEVADVLEPAKQAEIREVIGALARFRPTRIAVEQLPASRDALLAAYRSYRAGTHELTRNETQQIGFRLAARFEHPELYPIDHSGEFPFGPVMAYAMANDPEFAATVQREIGRVTEEANRQQREYTIGRILRHLNEPAYLASGHGLYMRFAGVGAGDTYVGANLLSSWYDRNIRIFANIQRIAQPGDRVIVLVGAGHAPILRELIAADPRMQLVETIDYLPRD